tara:strand:- start:1412 stop:1846 length:435 start_codon:yes stop_codon:yes gene_type:complete
MNRNLSIWNSLRPFSVGFDTIFDEFDRMLDSSEFNSNYPPYNIKKESENNYIIEVALAGFDKKDIEVELKDKTLTVRNKSNSDVIDEKGNGVIHKGISTRRFQRSFTISKDIKVKEAELKNGLLTIDLEQIVPDEKKSRLINIH